MSPGDPDVYLEPETKIILVLDENEIEIFNIDIDVSDSTSEQDLYFKLVTPEKIIELKLVLFRNKDYDDFRIEHVRKENEACRIYIGKRQYALETYFHDNPPVFWFVDGSSLSGNNYVELKHLFALYPKDKILSRSWDGIDTK